MFCWLTGPWVLKEKKNNHKKYTISVQHEPGPYRTLLFTCLFIIIIKHAQLCPIVDADVLHCTCSVLLSMSKDKMCFVCLLYVWRVSALCEIAFLNAFALSWSKTLHLSSR